MQFSSNGRKLRPMSSAKTDAVDYCMGSILQWCPRRIGVEQTGNTTFVIGEPGDERAVLLGTTSHSRAPIRLYEG